MGSFVYGDAAYDLTSTVITAVTLPSLFLTTKMTVEVTSSAFVHIDVLIDPLMTDKQLFFDRKPTADLDDTHGDLGCDTTLRK